MKRFLGSIVRGDNGATVATSVEVADTFLSRLSGLQFRKSLVEGHSFLIVPCNSIHTACMRFSIDALFLDRSGVVLARKSGLKPWRIAAAKGAHAVLELPAGSTESIPPGVRLALAEASDRPSVQFLIPADHAD